jgi:RNA polymerase sigma factor (sigma-70 family)
MTSDLGEHFFRREYGRLTAMLVRRFGVHHLERVEDAVQNALVSALESWPRSAVPDNPPAWLFRVAHHQLLGELRRSGRRAELAALQAATTSSAGDEPPSSFLAGDVRDDLLRMLFVCCDREIPIESQIVLALKVLCGFGVREIAERLFTSEANVYKRLTRARARLREMHTGLDSLVEDELVSRLPAVQSVVYLLFTEGYL